MLILNCGGTFNKRYNPLNGTLDVPYDNEAVEKILQSSDALYTIAGVIYKDSLEMNSDDRKILASIIAESQEDTFIVVHGTDTMELSAAFFAEVLHDKKIILTGAMKPFEIDAVEASFNLGMACGFAKTLEKSGVYICMNGHVAPWNEITKNREEGKFQIV